MMKKLIYSIILLCITYSVNASSDPSNGSTLLKRCQSAIDLTNKLPMDHDIYGSAYCFGFIQGFSESNTFFSALKNTRFFCIPEQVTLLQKTRVVLKYLTDHPNKLHENESYLVYDALLEGFPCE